MHSPLPLPIRSYLNNLNLATQLLVALLNDLADQFYYRPPRSVYYSKISLAKVCGALI